MRPIHVIFLCGYFRFIPEAIRVVNGPVSVTEGGSANLSCRLTETDEDLEQVTWQKRTRGIPENHNFLVILPPRDVRNINGLGNRARFIGNLTMKTGSIQILNVSLHDEGVYTCIFTVFPSGPHQAETRLTVHAIRVVNGPVYVTEGGSANLSCRLTETDEDLEQVTWQKRTRGIPDNHNFLVILPPRDVRNVNGLGNRVRFIGNLTMKTGSIQILNVSLHDEGVYTCIFTLFTSGPHQTETRLTVHVRPVVTVTPAAPLVVGGESGILATCIAANGRPAAGVSWRTDQLDGPTEIQNNATQNPNGTTTVRSYLLVTPTRSMNGREVQCVVNHTALEHEEIVPYRISVHYVTRGYYGGLIAAILVSFSALILLSFYTWKTVLQRRNPRRSRSHQVHMS
ncbi:OX-2 membrane glycoprotein-like isoform X2 [Paramormyrops kingsleyae]|uniref:OX-2 membrane glycoprotein-like isoform X2 n=2 Tax=Paramormyrops kingsleyae TaxID=1676925 RepID=UPI003B9728F5